MSKKNPFYNDTYLQELLQEGGGSGGDVTKEYVDQQDQALSQRIAQNTTNIANLSNSKADRAEIANKLDKLTDEGEYVYSHDGNVQTSKGFEVADEPSGSAAHVTSSKTVKAVKTALEKKISWTYVGVLTASSGSTITVGNDWNDLKIVMRLQEGSSVFNYEQVISKDGFTQGGSTNNTAMFGFYWNDSFKATYRMELSSTSGDNRTLKRGFGDVTGWNVAGFYIYKR